MNFILLLRIFADFVYKILSFIKPKPKCIRVTDYDLAKEELNNTNKWSRAIPNKFLVDIFKISNIFTDDDQSRRKSIHQKLEKKYMPVDKNKYNEIYRITCLLCDKKFCSEGEKLPLAKFIQVVSLGTFSKYFLHIEGLEDSSVGSLINELWREKKTPPSQKVEDKKGQLIDYLNIYESTSDVWRFLVEEAEKANAPYSDNLLNIIIPGYETMWRVVLYLVLELIRRPKLRRDILLEIEQNDYTYNQDSLLSICILEVLRCYPPTKHIYRQSLIDKDEQLIIDVEAINKDEFWGDRPEHFNPLRFVDKKMLLKDYWNRLASFGLGKSRCVAFQDFARKFLHALSSGIVQKLPFELIKEQDGELSDITKQLPNDRISFEDISLYLKS